MTRFSAATHDIKGLMTVLRQISYRQAWSLFTLVSMTTVPSAADALSPFNFGFSSASVTSLSLPIGLAKGTFAAQGLDLRSVSMEGGSRGVQVLLSGEIQAMHVGIGPLVLANSEGADLRMIAATINTIPLTLFALPKFKAAGELRSARFGVSTFGSESDIAVTLALKHLGIDRKTVSVSQLGGSSQRLAALIAGRVDAVTLPEPQTALAKARGFPVLLDLGAANTPWIYDAIVVQRSALKDTDTLARMLWGYYEATYAAFADPAMARAVIARQFKTNDPTVLDATYAEYRKLTPLDGRPSEAGVRNAIAELAATGVKIGSRNVEDYVDLGPLKALEARGFAAAMAKRYAVK